MSFVYYLTSLDYGHELQYLIYLPVVGEPYYSPGVIPFIFWSCLSQWLAVAVHLPFYHYYIYNSSVVAVLSMVCCFRLAIFLPLPSLLLVCSLPWWLAVAVISIFFYHCYLQFFTTFIWKDCATFYACFSDDILLLHPFLLSSIPPSLCDSSRYPKSKAAFTSECPEFIFSTCTQFKQLNRYSYVISFIWQAIACSAQ